MAAALALGLVSSMLASRSYVATAEWSVYGLMALLMMSARATQKWTLQSTVALVGVIVPAAYVTGVMANYVSALLLVFPIGAETLLVGFSNPRFPAQLQVLTIPLLPLAMQRAPSPFWRACLAVVAALWWMCFIGSGSRTGWIAITFAAALMLFFGAEGRRWLKCQLVFAATGAVLWVVLFHWLPALLSMTAAPETGRFSDFASVGARWKLWRISVESALAHPFLGLGPMHFAYVDNGDGAHPHNFWLQLAAEWGIPAALLIGAVTVAFFVNLWRAARVEADPAMRRIGVAVVAVVLAWGIGTLSDGYMVIPTSQVMSTAVLMLAVMWLRLASSSIAPSPKARLIPIVWTIFCAIALVVLAVLPTTDFGQPTQREQAWRVEHPGAFMWPRFWQQGWIGPDSDPTARNERRR
jgi:O-antigen ligase